MWWVWLLILLPLALWLAVRVRRLVRGRAHPIRGHPDDPKERQSIEDEVRRRQDGSGPTVAGGQHLA
jgi:hypothetical protein